MKTVKAPNKSFAGISGGIHFVNGTALVPDDTNTHWLEHHGYIVEKTDKKAQEEAEADAKAQEEAEAAAKAEADAKAQEEAEAAAKAEADAKAQEEAEAAAKAEAEAKAQAKPPKKEVKKDA